MHNTHRRTTLQCTAQHYYYTGTPCLQMLPQTIGGAVTQHSLQYPWLIRVLSPVLRGPASITALLSLTLCPLEGGMIAEL